MISVAGLVIMALAMVSSRSFGVATSLSERAGLDPPKSVDSENGVDEQTLTRPGQVPPNVFVSNVGSKDVFELQDLKGKSVVLTFFATSRPECVEEMPHLQRLWDSFGQDDRFAMCAISVNETADVVAAFREQHGFTLPMAIDETGHYFKRYALDNSVPRTYLVGSDGRIVSQMVGFDAAQFAQMRTAIESAVQ